MSVPARSLLIVTAGLVAALSSISAVAAQDVIDVNITNNAFEPAEVKATFGQPFTLRFHNKSAMPAEVESSKLRFEKVIPAGAEVVVKVRPQDAGSYMFFNDFKPTMRGRVKIDE